MLGHTCKPSTWKAQKKTNQSKRIQDRVLKRTECTPQSNRSEMGNSSACRTAFSTCISLDQTLVLAVEMGKILLYKAISEPAGGNLQAV